MEADGIKIYFKGGLYGDYCNYWVSSLEKAIEAFIEQLDDIKDIYLTVPEFRENCIIPDSYEIKPSEVCFLEIQKFVDGKNVPWEKDDFADVDSGSILSLKNILGLSADDNIEGLIKSEAFAARVEIPDCYYRTIDGRLLKGLSYL